MTARIDRDWPLLICLLGDFRVLKAGQPAAGTNSSKARTLLYVLGLRGGSVEREALLFALWPHSTVSLASQSLHSLVHNLHKVLGDAIAGAPPIVHADGYYRLNVEAGVGVDTTRFLDLADTGERRMSMGDRAGAIDAFDRAIALYRGDLCSYGEDSQAAVEREYLRARYLTLLAHVAEYQYDAGNYATCLAYAQRLLVNDPCREDAHLLAMRCYVRRGERAEALRQYRLCESILQAEFGVQPEPATTALFDRVSHDPDEV